MRTFWAVLGGFALVVLLMVGLYVSQSVLAREYGVRVAGALRSASVTTRQDCRAAFPEVRPRPLLLMLRSCSVTPAEGAAGRAGAGRVELTLTDGRSYRADVR